MTIYDNVLETIGGTPLIRINRLNPDSKVTVAVKLESRNPGGSIKDRVALAMIEAAEQRGELTPGKIVIEATSGNTGIGLAMVCAVKGYDITLVMSEGASEERKSILRAYGAELIETPARLSTDGAIEEVYRLVREHPDRYVLMDQYNNSAGVEAHARGTAREIWDQTGGRVDCVVACLGTTGTAMGLCRGLKTFDPAVRVVAVEPFSGHAIQGLKNMQESYPPGIYDRNVLDDVVRVEDERAFDMCRKAARLEGLFVGMSSGAALAGALDLAATMQSGTVVALLPDGGERYLSTSLYSGREEEGPAVSLLDGSKQVRPFRSKETNVLYAPGPSLDRIGDLDAWRRVVVLDVLARFLVQKGFQARLAVGLADFDDRALSGARAQGLDRNSFVRKCLDNLRNLAAEMGVRDAAFLPGGEDEEALVSICTALQNKGLAYEKLRSVYYDVQRDADYGRLAGMDLDRLSLGKTVDLERYIKDDPRDFTLFKRASLQDLKEGAVIKTQWGNVRPSWYLQMALAGQQSGGPVRIFLAGPDQIFPHVDNLGGIWRALKMPVGAWTACGPIRQVDDRETDLVRLLARNWPQKVLRFWLISTSWRRGLDCSPKTLTMWSKNQRKVQETMVLLQMRCIDSGPGKKGRDKATEKAGQAVFSLQRKFDQALGEGGAFTSFWPVLFGFCREANKLALDPESTMESLEMFRRALLQVDEVLGIVDHDQLPLPSGDMPLDVQELIRERQALRNRKKFQAADELRERMERQGYMLEDGPLGTAVFFRPGKG